MYIQKVSIKNRSGLHARPAAEFVAAAKKFRSRIAIRRAGSEEEVNAKSIVMLLSLSLCQGDEAEIICRGEDEEAAGKALADLVAGGFGDL